MQAYYASYILYATRRLVKQKKAALAGSLNIIISILCCVVVGRRTETQNSIFLRLPFSRQPLKPLFVKFFSFLGDESIFRKKKGGDFKSSVEVSFNPS